MSVFKNMILFLITYYNPLQKPGLLVSLCGETGLTRRDPFIFNVNGKDTNHVTRECAISYVL